MKVNHIYFDSHNLYRTYFCFLSDEDSAVEKV